MWSSSSNSSTLRSLPSHSSGSGSWSADATRDDPAPLAAHSVLDGADELDSQLAALTALAVSPQPHARGLQASARNQSRASNTSEVNASRRHLVQPNPLAPMHISQLSDSHPSASLMDADASGGDFSQLTYMSTSPTAPAYPPPHHSHHGPRRSSRGGASRDAPSLVHSDLSGELSMYDTYKHHDPSSSDDLSSLHYGPAVGAEFGGSAMAAVGSTLDATVPPAAAPRSAAEQASLDRSRFFRRELDRAELARRTAAGHATSLTRPLSHAELVDKRVRVAEIEARIRRLRENHAAKKARVTASVAEVVAAHARFRSHNASVASSGAELAKTMEGMARRIAEEDTVHAAELEADARARGGMARFQRGDEFKEGAALQEGAYPPAHVGPTPQSTLHSFHTPDFPLSDLSKQREGMARAAVLPDHHRSSGASSTAVSALPDAPLPAPPSLLSSLAELALQSLQSGQPMPAREHALLMSSVAHAQARAEARKKQAAESAQRVSPQAGVPEGASREEQIAWVDQHVFRCLDPARIHAHSFPAPALPTPQAPPGRAMAPVPLMDAVAAVRSPRSALSPSGSSFSSSSASAPAPPPLPTSPTSAARFLASPPPGSSTTASSFLALQAEKRRLASFIARTSSKWSQASFESKIQSLGQIEQARGRVDLRRSRARVRFEHERLLALELLRRQAHLLAAQAREKEETARRGEQRRRMELVTTLVERDDTWATEEGARMAMDMVQRLGREAAAAVVSGPNTFWGDEGGAAAAAAAAAENSFLDPEFDVGNYAARHPGALGPSTEALEEAARAERERLARARERARAQAGWNDNLWEEKEWSHQSQSSIEPSMDEALHSAQTTQREARGEEHHQAPPLTEEHAYPHTARSDLGAAAAAGGLSDESPRTQVAGELAAVEADVARGHHYATAAAAAGEHHLSEEDRALQRRRERRRAQAALVDAAKNEREELAAAQRRRRGSAAEVDGVNDESTHESSPENHSARRAALARELLEQEESSQRLRELSRAAQSREEIERARAIEVEIAREEVERARRVERQRFVEQESERDRVTTEQQRREREAEAIARMAVQRGRHPVETAAADERIVSQQWQQQQQQQQQQQASRPTRLHREYDDAAASSSSQSMQPSDLASQARSSIAHLQRPGLKLHDETDESTLAAAVLERQQREEEEQQQQLQYESSPHEWEFASPSPPEPLMSPLGPAVPPLPQGGLPTLNTGAATTTAVTSGGARGSSSSSSSQRGHVLHEGDSEEDASLRPQPRDLVLPEDEFEHPSARKTMLMASPSQSQSQFTDFPDPFSPVSRVGPGVPPMPAGGLPNLKVATAAAAAASPHSPGSPSSDVFEAPPSTRERSVARTIPPLGAPKGRPPLPVKQRPSTMRSPGSKGGGLLHSPSMGGVGSASPSSPTAPTPTSQQQHPPQLTLPRPRQQLHTGDDDDDDDNHDSHSMEDLMSQPFESPTATAGSASSHIEMMPTTTSQQQHTQQQQMQQMQQLQQLHRAPRIGDAVHTSLSTIPSMSDAGSFSLLDRTVGAGAVGANSSSFSLGDQSTLNQSAAAAGHTSRPFPLARVPPPRQPPPMARTAAAAAAATSVADAKPFGTATAPAGLVVSPPHRSGIAPGALLPSARGGGVGAGAHQSTPRSVLESMESSEFHSMFAHVDDFGSDSGAVTGRTTGRSTGRAAVTARSHVGAPSLPPQANPITPRHGTTVSVIDEPEHTVAVPLHSPPPPISSVPQHAPSLRQQRGSVSSAFGADDDSNEEGDLENFAVAEGGLYDLKSP